MAALQRGSGSASGEASAGARPVDCPNTPPAWSSVQAGDVRRQARAEALLGRDGFLRTASRPQGRDGGGDAAAKDFKQHARVARQRPDCNATSVGDVNLHSGERRGVIAQFSCKDACPPDDSAERTDEPTSLTALISR